jgi:uncharacterized membrane protein HdeD (DUF308 family)
MISRIDLMLIGAGALGALVAAAFFLRFFRATRDLFFLLFAVSFGVEGVNRFALGLCERPNEGAPWFYLIRLFSFSLILIAIAHKNRTKPP